jgi:hypothetical protein
VFRASRAGNGLFFPRSDFAANLGILSKTAALPRYPCPPAVEVRIWVPIFNLCHTSGASIAAIRTRITSLPPPSITRFVSVITQGMVNWLTFPHFWQPSKFEWPSPTQTRCMEERETIPVGHSIFSTLDFRSPAYTRARQRVDSRGNNTFHIPFLFDKGVRYLIVSPNSLEISRIHRVPPATGCPACRKDGEGTKTQDRVTSGGKLA